MLDPADLARRIAMAQSTISILSADLGGSAPPALSVLIEEFNALIALLQSPPVDPVALQAQGNRTMSAALGVDEQLGSPGTPAIHNTVASINNLLVALETSQDTSTGFYSSLGRALRMQPGGTLVGAQPIFDTSDALALQPETPPDLTPPGP